MMTTEGRKTALRCFCPHSGAHKCVRFLARDSEVADGIKEEST